MRSRALSGIFTSGRRPQGFSSTLLKVPNRNVVAVAVVRVVVEENNRNVVVSWWSENNRNLAVVVELKQYKFGCGGNQ